MPGQGTSEDETSTARKSMEHILHFFGGGCGEHMLWPWIVSVLSGGLGYGIFSKHAKK
tara:strand:+ start:938 stop:1111 length:174 start_codon:yes stop_codon:yes gene_type:complete